MDGIQSLDGKYNDACCVKYSFSAPATPWERIKNKELKDALFLLREANHPIFEENSAWFHFASQCFLCVCFIYITFYTWMRMSFWIITLDLAKLSLIESLCQEFLIRKVFHLFAIPRRNEEPILFLNLFIERTLIHPLSKLPMSPNLPIHQHSNYNACTHLYMTYIELRMMMPVGKITYDAVVWRVYGK